MDIMKQQGINGAPLDFIAFHAKGSPKVVNGVVANGNTESTLYNKRRS